MKMASERKQEKGFALIEVVIALAIVAIITSGFLMALSISSKAIFVANERTTAESLARSQMESVKEQEYSTISYDKIDLSGNNNYAIVDIVPPDTIIGLQDGLQKIKITVQHLGKDIITLEGYKVDR